MLVEFIMPSKVTFSALLAFDFAPVKNYHCQLCSMHVWCEIVNSFIVSGLQPIAKGCPIDIC